MIKAELDKRSYWKFADQLKRYKKLCFKTEDDIMRELGRASARQLAHFTLPFGLNNSVRDKFAKSVGKQVRRAVREKRHG